MFLLNFCNDTWDVWQLLGKFVSIFRIVVPLLLIVFSSIDLGKAVVATDEKVIKKSTKQIAIRFIFAILIFFVPLFISAIFNLIDNFKKAANETGYKACYVCLTKPNKCEEYVKENK